VSVSSAQTKNGFTLIEMMVALLIFSILATAGVALLSFSVRAQAASGAKLDDLAALQRTLSILSADLAQASARPVRDEAGTMLPAFVGEGGGGQPLLRLVRGGWTNLDAQPRAGAQKVAYQLVGGTLQRLAYIRLDGAPPLPAAALLTRVDGVTLRFRHRGAWSDRWDGAGGVPLPQALEVKLQRAGVEYRQLFLVGTGYTPEPEGADAPG
jgi:general secretion pathway protein J